MPFPLAHPAAVLPLRRFCPQRLDFPALIIGSLVPDLGYVLGSARAAEFSHRLFPGALVFDLPAGLALWLIFSALRQPVASKLPLRYRARLLPLCRRPAGLSGRVLASLFLGILTHLLLDSATHLDGWILHHLLILSRLAFGVGHDEHQVGDYLYYGCSFVGVGWLMVCYWQWLESSVRPSRPGHPGAKFGTATLFASVMLLVGGIARGLEWSGLLVFGTLSMILVAVFLTAADRLTARTATRP